MISLFPHWKHMNSQNHTEITTAEMIVYFTCVSAALAVEAVLSFALSLSTSALFVGLAPTPPHMVISGAPTTVT